MKNIGKLHKFLLSRKFLLIMSVVLLVSIALLQLYSTSRTKTSSATTEAALSYDKVKPILSIIYSEYPYAFYISCKFNAKTKQIVKKDCDYQSSNAKVYVNWEHIFPVSRFGSSFECWDSKKNNKRDYCSETEPKFAMMLADMHNIVPTLNTINSDRKNYDMAEIKRHYEEKQYGKIDDERRLFEPLDNYKGAIARVYLYMSKQYGLYLSREEVEMFDRWNLSYPPSDFECKKNKLVSEIQKTTNTYISEKCEN